jgi:aspartate/methionine/tyrosine aminotransferase
VKALVGRSIRGRTAQSSAELAELVLDEAEVAVVPGEAFGAPGYFRMSYALGDDDLAEGVTRLQKLLAEAQ